MEIGRRIYYDLTSGNVIQDTGEISNPLVTKLPIEDEIKRFSILLERNRETFDVLELPFGTYQQDFATCNGYRVNPDTKQLEFSYPDSNQLTAEPVYQKPLSVEVEDLKQSIAELTIMLATPTN